MRIDSFGRLLLAWTASAIAWVGLADPALLPSQPPDVSGVNAVHQDGKTYLTFTKAAQTETNYAVYRLEQVPPDLSGVQPLVTLPAMTHQHPDCQVPFVLPGGRRLTPEDGFFVVTVKSPGKVRYAVLPVGQTGPLVAGRNLTTSDLEEAPSGKPSAVFQMQKTRYAQIEDHYASWMDYEAYQPRPAAPGKPVKAPDYYGSFFSISYLNNNPPGQKLPVLVTLHAYGGGSKGAPFALCAIKGVYRIYVEDHNMRWWDGPAAVRIESQIDYLLNCGKYAVDPDRVYVEGNSMGGYGSVLHALRYAQKYAACYAKIPKINPAQTDFVGADMELPAISVYFGFKDGYNHGLKGQIPFIRKMQESRQGLWVRWADVGHDVPPTWNTLECSAPGGGIFRFRRNEPYPVFLNTSTDDNCGQRENLPAVSAGQINQTLDWVSSLHAIQGLDGPLVDTPAELAVSFQALADCTTDLGFRRAQAFQPMPGSCLSYQNLPPREGPPFQSGEIVVASNRVWIIPGVQMKAGGNRVIVRLKGP